MVTSVLSEDWPRDESYTLWFLSRLSQGLFESLLEDVERLGGGGEDAEVLDVDADGENFFDRLIFHANQGFVL